MLVEENQSMCALYFIPYMDSCVRFKSMRVVKNHINLNVLYMASNSRGLMHTTMVLGFIANCLLLKAVCGRIGKSLFIKIGMANCIP